MNFKVSTVFVVLIIALSIESHAQTVTYLGNEGIFIEYQGSKVLIDGLFEDPSARFDYPDNATITKIIDGKAPYNNINALLVTHAHPDHFNPNYSVQMLQNNKTTELIISPQGLDSMNMVSDNVSQIRGRIMVYPWARGWKTTTAGSVTIKSAYTRHAGKSNSKVQNNIFIITIGDKKLLHIGDSKMDVSNFDKLRLIYEDIDIAFVPFWFMTGLYGSEIVNKHIGAKKVVGIHMPSGDKNSKIISKINTQYPKSKVFQTVGDKITF
ncbi:MAG: MBL fold metallo-hydrolase [Reichenbachiella sp.]